MKLPEAPRQPRRNGHLTSDWLAGNATGLGRPETTPCQGERLARRLVLWTGQHRPFPGFKSRNGDRESVFLCGISRERRGRLASLPPGRRSRDARRTRSVRPVPSIRCGGTGAGSTGRWDAWSRLRTCRAKASPSTPGTRAENCEPEVGETTAMGAGDGLALAVARSAADRTILSCISAVIIGVGNPRSDESGGDGFEALAGGNDHRGD